MPPKSVTPAKRKMSRPPKGRAVESDAERKGIAGAGFEQDEAGAGGGPGESAVRVGGAQGFRNGDFAAGVEGGGDGDAGGGFALGEDFDEGGGAADGGGFGEADLGA